MYVILLLVSVLIISTFFIWVKLIQAYEEKRILKNILLTMIQKHSNCKYLQIDQRMKEGNIDYELILQQASFD